MAKEDSLDMDALSAHLDRGWDLLARGELLAARVSADRILEIDPESPDGHTLLGAICAAEGEPEEALDAFRRALDADPEHIDAMLYAAELAIHPLGQIDYAMRLCDEAEELLGDSQDLVEVLVLRAEAHLARGELDKAAAALERLPSPPYAEPAHYLRAGRILIDVDQPGRAVTLLEQASQHPSCEIDALYFLGVAREMAGDPQGALCSFLEVYERDRQLPEPVWSQPADAFAGLVKGVLESFPEPVGKALRAAALRIQSYPPIELVAEGFDPRSPVFFAGTWVAPKTKASAAKGAKRRRAKDGGREHVLTGVFVYKRNVERFAGSAEAVAEELSRALAQEAAFFFGIDPDDLERLLDASVERCRA